jgi:hypothetical protein
MSGRLSPSGREAQRPPAPWEAPRAAARTRGPRRSLSRWPWAQTPAPRACRRPCWSEPRRGRWCHLRPPAQPRTGSCAFIVRVKQCGASAAPIACESSMSAPQTSTRKRANAFLRTATHSSSIGGVAGAAMASACRRVAACRVARVCRQRRDGAADVSAADAVDARTLCESRAGDAGSHDATAASGLLAPPPQHRPEPGKARDNVGLTPQARSPPPRSQHERPQFHPAQPSHWHHVRPANALPRLRGQATLVRVIRARSPLFRSLPPTTHRVLPQHHHAPPIRTAIRAGQPLPVAIQPACAFWGHGTPR